MRRLLLGDGFIEQQLAALTDDSQSVPIGGYKRCHPVPVVRELQCTHALALCLYLLFGIISKGLPLARADLLDGELTEPAKLFLGGVKRSGINGIGSFCRRHQLAVGDVLCLSSAGPGALRVAVHRAGSQVGPAGAVLAAVRRSFLPQ